MNGKELLESMGHVDEQYVAEAEEAPKRRRYWQTIGISAACLALVLAGVWRFLPLRLEEQTEDSSPMVMTVKESARSLMDTNAAGAPAVASYSASALVRMTVRVTEITEEALLCQVVDPGTSDYQAEELIKITLQEECEASALYEVLFLPEQGTELLTPVQWLPLEDE